MAIRTVVERGPKEKKVVAFALDWPGWSRGGKSAEIAVDTLGTYRSRYRSIAALAGLETEFDESGDLEIVEDRIGTGSTDFWGISFSPCSLETEPIPEPELERKLALLQASWAYFDTVAARVSADLRKGPRGGGRDREKIISHTFGTERTDIAAGIGIETPPGVMLTVDGLADHRERYLAAIRGINNGDIPRVKKTWNLPYLIRHTAFHMLDHAWEMEDKDLTGETES